MKIRKERKKFNSFPPSRESFSFKRDYSLQFFTTQRTLLSLSMEISEEETLYEERCIHAFHIYVDKQKISLHFYCWFLWFRRKSIFLLCCLLVVKYASQAEEVRIINFYYACQFSVWFYCVLPPISLPFTPHPRASPTFLICLMYIYCLDVVVEMIKHKNKININIWACITNNNL